MRRQHKGLDLAGIIIIYIMSLVYIGLMIFSWLDWGYLELNELILLIVSTFSLLATILYHNNLIKNHIIIGIFGILVSIVGGIFILTGQPKSINCLPETKNKFNLFTLEYKLEQLDSLLVQGVITHEEYIIKRRTVIEKTDC